MTKWAAFSDQELWSRAVESNDSEAFGQLFERHADSVPIGTVRSRLARSRQHLRDQAARHPGPLSQALSL